MSDQISETVQPSEAKLEGGKIEVAVPAPESALQGGAAAVQGDATLQGGAPAQAAEASPADVLTGGSKRKTRSDKGHKRGRYSRHSGNPSSKQREYLASMLTPGQRAYYRSKRGRCQRGSHRSKRYGTCVKDVGGKRANLIEYGVHRRASGKLRSTKSRSKARKSLSKGMRRSTRPRKTVARLGFEEE